MFMSMEETKEHFICTYDPLLELMARFENIRVKDTGMDPFEGLSIEQTLKKHIIEGIKKKLDQHIAEALETYPPLDIINQILLEGMKEVGDLFGSGKMQLPFVLQSAEVMKASVKLLEPFMEKIEGHEKGSILLATVSGDVHDIGKNLVDIILTNNGYRVVNIGIKQPLSNILEKTQEHSCQAIGLSGLLVKSTLIMRENLLEMNKRQVHNYPVILGGAALTRAYVEEDLRALYKGNVYYAQDAFEGLRLMEQISKKDRTQVRPEQTKVSQNAQELPHSQAHKRVASHRLPDSDPALYLFTGVKSEAPKAQNIPHLPFYGRKKQEKFDIFEIYKYINPIALWRGQWQYRRNPEMDNLTFNTWLEEHVRPIFNRFKQELASMFAPRVAWGYFWCQSQGNDLILYHEDAKTERHRFTFPRQSGMKRLCLADFFRPVESGEMDVVGLQIVTVGGAISQYEKQLFASGNYEDYLYVHGMGVETAEALAEYWHKQMRHELGIDQNDPEEMKLLFSAKYQGARFSFGYPACPNLEDQKALIDLLKPEEIGIELSEEYMLIPEQSTSAIVIHHPAAKYFNVK